jgi:hypothetical protein
MVEYDPLDHETWPTEQLELAGRAVAGLQDGTLSALGSYLKAGYLLDHGMAHYLVDLIDGTGGYQLKDGVGRPNQTKPSLQAAITFARMQRGQVVEKLMREFGRGWRARVLAGSSQFFDVSERTLENDLRLVRETAATMPSGADFLSEPLPPMYGGVLSKLRSWLHAQANGNRSN